MTIQVFINALFFVELFIDLLVHGTESFSKSFRVWPETLCQLVNIYATIIYFVNFNVLSRILSGRITDGAYNPNQLIKMFELIIFIRILKMITLLYELDAMRLVIETMRNMIIPLLQVMSVLFVIFYIFSVLGMYLFGGMSKT